MIQTHHVSLRYSDHGREVFACRAIDLMVRPNEFLGILGPSGSGKSSLLYLLSGLKVPTDGRVEYNGRNLADLNDGERSRLRLREFGFIFQQPYLLGYLNSLENVLVSFPDEPLDQSAVELLQKLGLSNKLDRFPYELSGGERQRVCVARALLGQPKVIFADEPTAALDHTNGLSVVNLLNQHRGEGSLVMVTHDPSMLEQADRIVRIVDGELDGTSNESTRL